MEDRKKIRRIRGSQKRPLRTGKAYNWNQGQRRRGSLREKRSRVVEIKKQGAHV